MQELEPGDTVCLQDPRDNIWSKECVIARKLQHRSYLVKLTNGNFLLRNRVHIRKSNRVPGQTADYNFDSNDPQIPQAQQEQHLVRDQPEAIEQWTRILDQQNKTKQNKTKQKNIRRPKRLIEATIATYTRPAKKQNKTKNKQTNKQTKKQTNKQTKTSEDQRD